MSAQPNNQEEEYFAKLEIRRRLEEQARRANAQADEEKKRLKELHFMHCPKCGTSLHEDTLEGVTIDVCPICRGVWLDDGELGKVIESKKGVLAAIQSLFT